MKKLHVRKTSEKIIFRILMIPLLALLIFGAIQLGIIGGNYLYSLDSRFIEQLDTDYFKSTLNTSLPIINTVYNSGNTGISIFDDLKRLAGGIFDLNMDYPASIFNSQSALFYSYYKGSYMKGMLAESDAAVPAPDNSAQTSPTPVPAPTPTVPGTDNAQEQTPGKAAPGDSTSGDNSSGNNTSINNSQGNTSNGTDGSDTANSLEPTSSIVYNEEDEDKSGKVDIVSHGKISVQNHTSFKIDIEKLLSEPFSINFRKKGPQVLIYHTHTTESYVLRTSDLGKKSVPIYNKNPNYSVVRVGDELARNLRKYGIDVLHNGTVHDYNHNSAYSASLKTLMQYKKSYPSIKIYFDLHRDGLEASKPKLRVTTTINKKTAAQVMFVVGTNGNLPHPRWKENLKFALKLQQKLNEKHPGLARPVFISSNRYNQQVSDDSLIIEIGGDGNLLSECLESTKYVAEAVNAVIKGN